ncbi:MAG: hypothetical protein QF815_04005 [Candidatus Peribacteraceae bacterium]|jgi:hypothetical protein|nr:hypothetical protein [Candidatus Peribacteraceae bacterium]MDP7476877.1 hypothetical protein [Candidatus Peribacteraceae bacterium]
MALLLPHSLFIHIPKTGGCWVQKAIKRSGIPYTEIGNRHDNLDRLGSVPDRFTFAFVRNPLTWYQSQWSYKMKHGWQTSGNFNGAWLDSRCASDRFDVFIRNCIEHFPKGVVSQIYHKYLGEDQIIIDYVGRQENAAEDLIIALRSAGEEFDEESIRLTKDVNVSDPLWKNQCQYTPEFVAAVVQYEEYTLKKFGYWKPEYDKLHYFSAAKSSLLKA